MRTSSGILLLAALGACPSQRAVVTPGGESRSRATLPFVEDDYPRALADARARGVPIFVDAWAPW